MVQSPNMPPVSAVVEGEITGIQRARTNANEELDVSVQFPWNYQHPTHLYVRMGTFDGLDLTTAYGTYKFQVRRGNPHKGKEGSSTLWDYRFDLEVFNPDLPVTPSQSEYGNYADVFLENAPPVLVNELAENSEKLEYVGEIVMPAIDENGDIVEPTYAEKDEVEITPEDTRKPSQGGPSPMHWPDARGEDAGKTPTMDYRSAVIQWQNARTTAIAMISAQPELYGGTPQGNRVGHERNFEDAKEYEAKIMEVAKRCYTELWPEWLAPRIQRARK